MPAGAKPGERRGGRAKGKKNAATLEREAAEAERAVKIVEQARHKGEKLATEVLNEFMFLFAGMAASHQPLPDGMAAGPGRAPNERKFRYYAEQAVWCAKALAPYQSPQFRAVAVTMTQPSGAPPAVPGDDAKVIDINDPVVVQQTYLRMVKARR